jgi:ketosteroid isomerase-like protein
MRTLIISAGVLAALAGALVGSFAHAATADEVSAPITAFLAAFDKGDLKTAAAQTTGSMTIIDEVAPYSWTGPNALTGWASDLIGGDAKAGLSGESVAISAPSRIETSGDSAYVVVPAVYSFKDHGAPMREGAQMTFALRKDAGGWKIAAWTWTGPKATPAN